MKPTLSTDQYKAWFYSEIGKNIKQRRKEIKEHQQSLAYCLDITRTHLYLIESGRKRMPLHLIHRAAHYLKTTVGELLPKENF